MRIWAVVLLLLGVTPQVPALQGTDDTAVVFEAVIREVALERVVAMEAGSLPAKSTLLVQTDLVPITPGYPTEIPAPPASGDPAVLQPWASELPLEFASASAIRAAFEAGGWKAIHEKWPSALCTVQFSAVRFQEAPERRAVVEVAVIWGELAAEAYLVDLRWRDGGWKVVSVLPGWIS
jgi:hypothetical protein